MNQHALSGLVTPSREKGDDPKNGSREKGDRQKEVGRREKKQVGRREMED